MTADDVMSLFLGCLRVLLPAAQRAKLVAHQVRTRPAQSFLTMTGPAMACVLDVIRTALCCPPYNIIRDMGG